MKRCMQLALILACLASGCTMGPHRFNRQRAESYVKRHPALSGPMAERLLSGYVAVGMSKQEVRLCLGSPDHREKVAGDGDPCDVWEYTEPAFRKGELRSSEMWARETPIARVLFGADGKVASYRYFGTPVRVESPPAKVSQSVTQRRVAADRNRTATEPKGQGTEPRTNTIPADWPSLSLNGVSVIAGVSYAMINRQVVSLGGRIDGVTLLYMRGDGVYLQLGESVRFLAIGKSMGK